MGNGAAAPARTEPDWLTSLRADAQQRFEQIPKPVLKDRGWEFTDLTDFDPDARDSVAAEAEIRIPNLPDGVVVSTLAEAARDHPELIEDRLASLVSDRDKFTAQNTARWSDGLFVLVPPGVILEQPIEVTVEQSVPGALHWRSLIIVEPGARATVIERYGSREGLDSYFNPVSELIVGDEAKLDYLCSQDLSERSWILGSQRAQVGADAELHWIGLGLGGGNGKLRMETDLRGRGSSARVTGAYAIHGSQRIDYETTQEHFAPDTTSDLAFRGILTEHSRAVWSGMIRVDPGAQRTDAFQESRNLLIGDGPHADAIPGLEIEADDVRCTHAATISKLNEDELFYLQTRGLPRSEAERLLIGGFVGVVVARLEGSEPLHDIVESALERELEAVLG